MKTKNRNVGWIGKKEKMITYTRNSSDRMKKLES
jgi:hypothetical protein